MSSNAGRAPDGLVTLAARVGVARSRGSRSGPARGTNRSCASSFTASASRVFCPWLRAGAADLSGTVTVETRALLGMATTDAGGGVAVSVALSAAGQGPVGPRWLLPSAAP